MDEAIGRARTIQPLIAARLDLAERGAQHQNAVRIPNPLYERRHGATPEFSGIAGVPIGKKIFAPEAVTPGSSQASANRRPALTPAAVHWLPPSHTSGQQVAW